MSCWHFIRNVAPNSQVGVKLWWKCCRVFGNESTLRRCFFYPSHCFPWDASDKGWRDEPSNLHGTFGCVSTNFPPVCHKFQPHCCSGDLHFTKTFPPSSAGCVRVRKCLSREAIGLCIIYLWAGRRWQCLARRLFARTRLLVPCPSSCLLGNSIFRSRLRGLPRGMLPSSLHPG